MFKLNRIVIILGILIAVAILLMVLNLNTFVKNGVRIMETKVLGVDVELEESNLSIFSGGGSLKSLKVHNPNGYMTEHLFRMNDITLILDLVSLTGDTIHIKEIFVDGPHVIYEGGLLESNIKALLDNLEGETADEPVIPGIEDRPSEENAPFKKTKMIIDHLLIKDVKMRVSSDLLQGKALTLPLPTIELRDIGKDEGGVTFTEVITGVVKELYRSVKPAIFKALGNLSSELKMVQDQIIDRSVDDKLKIKDGALLQK